MEDAAHTTTVLDLDNPSHGLTELNFGIHTTPMEEITSTAHSAVAATTSVMADNMTQEDIRDFSLAAAVASAANVSVGDGVPESPPQEPGASKDGPLTSLASAATTQKDTSVAHFSVGQSKAPPTKPPDEDPPPSQVVIGAPVSPENCNDANPAGRVAPKAPGAPHCSSTGKTKGDYQKKYRSTDKGRAAQRKAQEKYRRSEKGKVAQVRARKKWRESNPYQRSPARGAPAPGPDVVAPGSVPDEAPAPAVADAKPAAPAPEAVAPDAPDAPATDVVKVQPPAPAAPANLSVLGAGDAASRPVSNVVDPATFNDANTATI